jgi:secreted trypsin-like serine protease
MKKYILVSVTAIASFFIFFSAVLRKDVPIEKYLKYGKRPEFSCVGELINGQGSCDGTCVLIANRFVLTAAHAHSLYENGTITCKFGERTYKVRHVIIHPRYNRKTFYGPDLAVLELEDTVGHIEPATLNQNINEKGKRGSIIGYGYIRFGGFPTTPLCFGHRIGGENMIDSIGGKQDSVSHQPMMLLADFDSPRGNRCDNVMGSPKALPLEFGTSAGDSGAGIFFKERSQWFLAGIVHGTTHMVNPSAYGEVDLFIRVSIYCDWIKSTIQLLENGG